jgi:hypothetical protein
MQAEILAADPASRVRMIGVNGSGYESATSIAVEGQTLPFLQDTPADAAWSSWKVEQDDAVVLDGDGNALGLLNLARHNLSYAPDYDLLLDYLLIAAGE